MHPIRRIAAAITVTLTFALAAPALAGEADDYKQAREDIWQWSLDNSPWLSESVGDRRNDGKLGDMTIEKYDREIAETRAFLARLNAIDESKLPDDLRVDYGIVKTSLEDAVKGSAFDQARYVLFTNRGGWFSSLPGLANRSPFFTATDYESYLQRLEAYPGYNRQGIVRTRVAIDKGLTQACAPMEGTVERLSTLIAGAPEESVFYGPFRQKPATISDEQWAQYKARAVQVIAEDIYPAYEEFFDFYRDEYEPECRTGAPGIAATPGGKEYYDYLVGSFTTTDMTADQVHELGLSEVTRIRAEMEGVAAEAGYDTREAFIEHLRTDPQYYAKTPDELMEAASALAKQIDGWMPKLFGLLPRQPYTVLPIPAAQAPGNTTAYYESGSLETGQPGIYRVNTTELDQRPLYELPALGSHEAVPGHHHQIALQQELDLHPLRRNGTFFTAFVEGWGLYSERLGIEMGIYDTPAKQMGRLSYEMWRATRLVVDTGLHSKGWTKQQAVDFMTEHTALSAGNIDAEVNRYITWPGQALAYKIGELKIRELRARAEEALGSEFDLRAFHDAVLENGAVPLDVLDAHIDRWIAAQQEG
ncbi:DUF885 domain-containing protein [Pseudoblastomonas halimionae]|uniref:DUF885 family protein n=1 Tax=Alteriqipengyuania halimionae TaxID=1926630 RepID=A0A6I4U5B8_9SPHN|nr:DUF885 domain-containing protein [Alteriqipengyuania halimionae]MXP09642.1 DUF885 family protein [Alteriqipengyuania halimionae]